MAGTIVADIIQSDQSYASSINIASPMVVSNTLTMGAAAAISGNVNFDSGTLFVDSINNRIGIGTTTPNTSLDIKGNTDTWAGMAKIYFTDVASDPRSRNWAIGNGGSGFGHLSFNVSTARYGNPADGTNGTPVVYIDSTGRVTKPYHPYAAVSRNAGNVSGGNVFVFNSAGQNIGSVYNTSTGRFTAPIAGRYFFSFQTLAMGTAEFWARVRVNGTPTNLSSYRHITASVNYTNDCGSGIFTLAENDYVDLYIDRGTAYGGDGTQCNAYFYFLG